MYEKKGLVGPDNHQNLGDQFKQSSNLIWLRGVTSGLSRMQGNPEALFEKMQEFLQKDQ
jgi:hypothetical protein